MRSLGGSIAQAMTAFAGFADSGPDHPRADLLKRKGLIVGFPPIPRALLTSPKLVKWLADGCKKTARLVEWLAFATA